MSSLKGVETMKSRFIILLVFAVTVLAFSVAGADKPLSLADTKWKLVGFVNAATHEIDSVDYSLYGGCCAGPYPTSAFPGMSTDDWFTLEFSTLRLDSLRYSGQSLYSGKFTYDMFNGGYIVDYERSVVDLGNNPWTIDGPVDSPDGNRFYYALGGSHSFELTEVNLKLYYLPQDSEKMEYLLLTPWEKKQGSAVLRDTGRVIPGAKSAMVMPEIMLSADNLAAGPNPVAKSAGLVNFYRAGRQIRKTSLKIYDATGKAVGKININDSGMAVAGQNQSNKRHIGLWDLKDAAGRPISEGTYLVKGTIKTTDRKSEKIALLISVR
jgi:hypothetical protein